MLKLYPCTLIVMLAVGALAPMASANPTDDAQAIANAAIDEGQKTLDHYGRQASAAANETSRAVEGEAACFEEIRHHANETAQPDEARAATTAVAVSAVQWAGEASRGNVVLPEVTVPDPGPTPVPEDVVHYLLVQAPGDVLAFGLARGKMAKEEVGFGANETQDAAACLAANASQRIDDFVLGDLPAAIQSAEERTNVPSVASEAYGQHVAPAYGAARGVDPWGGPPEDLLLTACETAAEALDRDPAEYCESQERSE